MENANCEIPVQNVALHMPPLEELASVIEKSLKANYKEASCKVVDCPNLTREPYKLAAPGICGSTRLAGIGGVPYLLPISRFKEKVYDLKVVKDKIGLPTGFLLGAGAGSKHVVGVNCEMIPNVKFSEEAENFKNLTHISKVDISNNEPVLEGYQEMYQSTQFCLLCDLFGCEGKGGKVLKIHAKHRTGEDNLVSCMRKGIASQYGKEKPVGMGGTFLTKSGNLKTHVMPDFSKTPLHTNEDVNNWLNFYTMRAPFVCMSTFVSEDPGLDLRLEHSHGYSLQNKEGGHYHTDVTPTEVEYEGFYNIAEYIFRLDRPEVTHMIGRD